MNISATGGGGFAGLEEHYQIDTATHPQGKALEAALAALDFFAAPADATPDSVGADLQRWRISVAAPDGRQHSVSFVEDGGAAGARWQSLLAQIRAA